MATRQITNFGPAVNDIVGGRCRQEVASEGHRNVTVREQARLIMGFGLRRLYLHQGP